MASLIEVWALGLLGEEPMHGYELFGRLVAAGVVPAEQDKTKLYRLLQGLEEGGFVEFEWDTTSRGPAKKVYRRVREGACRLDELVAELQAEAAAMSEAIFRWTPDPTPRRRSRGR